MKNFRYLFILTVTGILFFTKISVSQVEVEKIAGGFQFVEGPLWKDSLGLLFSDIRGNTIYLWSPLDSSTKPYLQPSDSSNGLAFDSQGRLILTQMRLRRIARQESNGTIVPLASTYNGKKFNSPNDIAIKSDGSIFFTDPDFNIPYPYNSELGFRGIYRISLSGTVQLLDSTFDKPNGICFSPHETKLYVNDSQKRIIYVWDVINDSTITNKREFARITPTGYADGMKTDSGGNIYCTGPLGVWVISPSGVLLDTIRTPENPSNCNWGDADRKTLYITAGKNVYRYRLPITDVENEKGILPEGFELHQNYPNPFNPTTNIGFRIVPQDGGFVSLKVYNVLGKEMATLVNEEMDAGEYEVEFGRNSDLTGVPSGVYFYQLSVAIPIPLTTSFDHNCCFPLLYIVLAAV